MVIVGMLAACAGSVWPAGQSELPPSSASVPARSRWVAVSWAELPGFGADAMFEAWNAWLRSCERAVAPLEQLCRDVRQLSIGSQDERYAWMQARLQPYRIESLQGDTTGLLTGYFEPVFDASRTRTAEFAVPLYQPPARSAARKPWYTRQEIDTLADAQLALKGREIAFLADPIDALVLQIQGSGRLRLIQGDGSVQTVRLSFAGSNDQPYRSVGRWLVDQAALREISWPAIKAWARQNPKRLNEMLWSNPRTVFFREEPLAAMDAGLGPTGAQGVALTARRSIAIDPGSIPYGTPVWLSTSGDSANLNLLVLAQDTGAAIVGALRADYFIGTGLEAGELAGRLKQPVRLWALWPK